MANVDPYPKTCLFLGGVKLDSGPAINYFWVSTTESEGPISPLKVQKFIIYILGFLKSILAFVFNSHSTLRWFTFDGQQISYDISKSRRYYKLCLELRNIYGRPGLKCTLSYFLKIFF